MISEFFPNKPWFLRVCSVSLENTEGKGEIAHNKQFLLFPPVFSTCFKNFLSFFSNLKLSVNSFSLEESKICRLRKGETKHHINIHLQSKMYMYILHFDQTCILSLFDYNNL